MNLFKIIILIMIVVFAGVITSKYINKEDITADHSDVEKADDSSNTAKAALVDGEFVISVPREIQEKSGIQTIELVEGKRTESVRAVAFVIDTLPLAELAARYHESQHQLELYESALKFSSDEYNRLLELHREVANISGKELQNARYKLESDRLNIQSEKAAINDIESEATLTWGEDLASQMIQNDGIVADVISGQSSIIQVTLPVGYTTPPPEISVSNRFNPDKLIDATYISTATNVDSQYGGLTFFYAVMDKSIRKNMYLDAWLTNGNKIDTGMYLPQASIIWYVDKPWVYIKTNDDSFIRREVTNYQIDHTGWFVTTGFNAGDKIVVSGAQMLLSEEFRWSIPDEDDNP